MNARGLSRSWVPALALAVGLAAALVTQRDDLARYDRHVQPGFDARVYQAMAEEPAFFTLAPWGYRLLTPWLVHLIAAEPGPAIFLALTLVALAAAGLLLHVFLVRLGHTAPRASLALLVFGLSPPVMHAVGVPFLAEPVIFLLLMLFLVGLEAGWSLATLAALGALGALGKDIFLFFLPAVFFVRRDERGARRALLDALLVAAPALALTWLLRAWWTPYLPEAAGQALGSDVFWLALWRILSGAERWLAPALLLGATPLALLGLLRPAGRSFALRHGYLLAVTWALPFAASVYTDDVASLPFFSDDIPRLLLYALPPTLHLALVALRAPGPRDDQGAPPHRAHLWRTRTALVAIVATLAFPLLALDRYRRVDLRGPRDGPLLLAVSRQSLAFARRLAAGRTLAYDVAARRFRPGRDEPRYLERMRWFLRDGWGDKPHYGVGPATLRARHATLLLPCLRPAPLSLTFVLRAPASSALAVSLNGRELGRARIEGHARLKVHAPADALARGDNLLALDTPDGAAVELLDLRVQPEEPRD